MPPAVDGGSGPILEDLQPPENLVHVNNIRLFQSEMCITSEPTEDGEPLTIWNFFQNLAGSDQTRKIKTVKVLSGSGASCKCGAKKDGTQGLRDLCLCRGGWATISFSSPDGAEAVTDRLDAHKRLHDSGAGPLGNRDVNGCVTFCVVCCLFQRQVHVSRAEPPAAAELLEQPDLGVGPMLVMPQDRLEAVIVILSGIIQGNYPRDTGMLKNSVTGSIIVEAERGIRAGAETLIRKFCGRTDTVCEYYMDYYIKATARLLPQEGLELAYKVVGILSTAEPGQSMTVREQLMLNLDIDARTALITKLAQVATDGWITGTPRFEPPPTANHSNAYSDQRSLSRDRAMERNLTECLQRLRDILSDNPPDTHKDTSIGLTRLRLLINRVIEAFEEVTDIFEDVSIPDVLETRYREYFRQLTSEKDSLLRVLIDETQKALLAAENSGRGHVSTEPVENGPPNDDPNGDEIDHEVSLFTAHSGQLQKWKSSATRS